MMIPACSLGSGRHQRARRREGAHDLGCLLLLIFLCPRRSKLSAQLYAFGRCRFDLLDSCHLSIQTPAGRPPLLGQPRHPLGLSLTYPPQRA